VALAYAERQHAGQLSGDGTPLVAHLLEVASLLDKAGAADYVVIAGILHDTVEKTSTTAFDLRRRFGSRVASLVLAVTEDQRIENYAKRKQALREQVGQEGGGALTLFAADKVSKVRELRREQAAGRRRTRAGEPRATRRQRLRHYRHCLALLEELLPDSPLVSQLRKELARATGGGRTLATR
jgi:(p)ppGpp synthase/HD superfamily hydrolase